MTDVDNRIITCPDCHEPLEWEDGDLQIDPLNKGYYFVECPICKGRIYITKTKKLDENYKKFSKK